MFKRFSGRGSEFDQKVPLSAFVIYKREASWLVAAFLLLCLLSFLAGYFMGQRKAIRAFVQQTSEEALLEQSQPESIIEPTETKSEEENKGESEERESKEIKNSHFYAPIAANDKYAQALNLVDIAHKNGVELRIKKSSRKLKNGRRKVTYQIVTAPYSDKEELQKDLESLKNISQFKKISINIRKTEQEG
jgi:hypothetical protein